MPYDSMAAWDRTVFQFNDSIQKRYAPPTPPYTPTQTPPSSPTQSCSRCLTCGRGASWRGKFSFDSDVGRTISRDDYSPPSPPASSAEDAPRFTDTIMTWSPPPSPRTQSPSSLSPPASPRSPSTPQPLSAKEKNSLADKLYAAACAGDLEHIQFLLNLGAPINSPTMIPELYDAFKPAKPGSLSALAGAAGNGNLDAVELLLANGAALNPNMKQSSSSPLHQACKADDVEIARFLLDAGADVDSLNCYRTTPLMYAVKYGSAPLVSVLLSFQPNLAILSFMNTTVMHWAVWQGNADVMEQLLMAGADPNVAAGDGSAPLHYAAAMDLEEVADVLVRYGADPLKRNDEWKTSLQIAEESGHESLAELLREVESAK